MGCYRRVCVGFGGGYVTGGVVIFGFGVCICIGRLQLPKIVMGEWGSGGASLRINSSKLSF